MMKSLMLMLLAIAAFSAHAAGELYKWRDAEGHVHYSDQPPPAGANSVERKTAKGNVVESDNMPFQSQEAAKKNPVTLYSFKDCGDPCTSAESYLAKRGIPFTLKNQEQDKLAVQKLTGDMQVPVMVVGTQSPLKGFQEAQWGELLDLAGYPRSNPLGNLKKVPASSAAKPAPKDD